MTISRLTKVILPPVLAAAAVFSAMTIPLAVIGEKQINIKFQEETLFFGKLRDVALPYVVVATGLSLGAGISTIAMYGWRKSSRRSTEVEEQLSQLELHLQQKEELLNEFKLSETRLQVDGLDNFLNEEVSSQTNKGYPTSKKANVSQSVALEISSQAYQPSVETISSSVSQNKRPDRITVNAASAFASAQNFLGYTKSNNNIKQELENISQANQTSINPSEFEQLQRQIKDMMLEMQAMQKKLPLMSESNNDARKQDSETISIHYDTQKPQQVKFL